MQKKIFSKILSTILVLSLILSVFIPMGNIIGVAEEVKEPSYSSVLNKVANCEADGWVASFSSNPQGGIAFTDQSAVSDMYECWSGGITRRQMNINWNHNASNANVFSNMGALTYTAQKYKYFTMTIEYKYERAIIQDLLLHLTSRTQLLRCSIKQVRLFLILHTAKIQSVCFSNMKVV